MADKTREQSNSRLRRALRSFLIFFLVLVIVLGVVVVAAYRDGTGLDVLRRYLNYGDSEKSGGETIYEYDASAQTRSLPFSCTVPFACQPFHMSFFYSDIEFQYADHTV